MASRDHYRNLSRRLSRVMDDIGVNEEFVMSWRKCILIAENLQTLCSRLLQINRTAYRFGSQTECTTTYGLNSDEDHLFVDEDYNLIQDLNDWVPGKWNLLMIQDEAFPGYCKLQLLKPDGPCPQVVLPHDKFTFDEAGRVILLNHVSIHWGERHGPAEQIVVKEGSPPDDFVDSIRCKTWPNGYKIWSTHPRKGTWPTPEMISYMEKSGCFVVQVAHCLDEKKSESWRISTSLAERCLMFSLNITQIRCYTLIKMIVKTFIDPVKPDVISSYICKNLLFHCVENTKSDFWQESNLLRCVNQILLNMLEAIRCMNCPNYFNESINLFLGKVNKDNKVVLMGVIWKVLISEGAFLKEILFDNINESIRNCYENISRRTLGSHAERKRENYIMSNVFGVSVEAIKYLMKHRNLSQRDLVSIENTMRLFALQGHFQYISATLLFPFLCSHLATLKANEHILHGKMISDITSFLYERSLDSDATSSRLKYASYLYCTRQFARAKDVSMEMRQSVNRCFLVCLCDKTKRKFVRNTDPSPSTQCLSHASMCVVFSHAERRCCPRELQYEMYRSTEQEKLQRHKYGYDDWMDLACIDSLPFFYFLSYMTGRHIGHRDIQSDDLELLKERTREDMGHRETVYNLLGQCYEYENRFNEAFACYCKSLRLRPTNNAAIWHIVLLLYTVDQNK